MVSKYRFKTKEEFIRDGQWDGKIPYGWNSSGRMDHYMGHDVPEEYNEKCDKGERIKLDTDNGTFNYWSFNPEDYVAKEQCITYEIW